MNSKSTKGMRNLKKLVLFAAMLGCCMGWSKDAFAAANCFCKASCANLTNQTSASMVVKDYGQLATYTGPFQQSDANQTACNTLCTNKCAPDTGSQAIATAACAIGCGNGSVVRCWSAVGTKEYKSAQQLGVLIKTPQVTATTCKCPTGWLTNTTNVDGGVTADGKCKKSACYPITISPYPADGTPIGSGSGPPGAWGFSWANGFYAWGTTANKGAAVCSTTVTSPAVCKF